MRWILILACAGMAACSSESGTTDVGVDLDAVPEVGDATSDSAMSDAAPDSSDVDVAPDWPAVPDLSPLGGDARPAEVFLPDSYTVESEWPVAVLLHGYGASGLLQRAYLNLVRLTEELGFILITPDGMEDPGGKLFWNAFPECCDFYESGVDDVGYLTSLIDEAESRYRVDRERVYFFGHSNGGYMSYRMACELGDRVAGVAVLAGAMTDTHSLCADTGPVNVLHIHGTDDDSVLYSDAQPSTDFWAARNGCGDSAAGEPLDLAIGPDAETEVVEWDCAPGGDVELWTMVDVGHLPAVNTQFSAEMLGWLLARPRE